MKGVGSVDHEGDPKPFPLLDHLSGRPGDHVQFDKVEQVLSIEDHGLGDQRRIRRVELEAGVSD